MIRNLLSLVLLLLGVDCGLAQTTVPDTPAGHTLQAWLDAFNSGDRAKIETYVKTVDHSQAVDGMLAFRTQTGGFDLIFLDVQMPEMDGVATLKHLGGESPAAVIFVTAYDQYAVEAFDLNAADYLLKPFTPQRFRQAFERAKTRIQIGSQRSDARMLAILERLASQPTYLSRIAVAGAAGTSFVETKNVDWLKAAENYVELHVGPDCYLVEVTMAEIAKRLEPVRFIRIHRSVIVNAERIRTVQSASHSEYLVTLTSGIQLRSGRTYKETMRRLISNPF